MSRGGSRLLFSLQPNESAGMKALVSLKTFRPRPLRMMSMVLCSHDRSQIEATNDRVVGMPSSHV